MLSMQLVTICYRHKKAPMKEAMKMLLSFLQCLCPVTANRSYREIQKLCNLTL